MVPAAVYPVPESAEATALLLLLAASAALPLYLLAFRPTRGRSTWGVAEMAAVAVLFMLTLPLAALMAGIRLPLSLADLSVVSVAQNALFVGAPAYVVMARYGLPATALGIRADGWPRLLVLGTVATAVTTPLAILSERLAIFLIGLVEGPAQAAARAAAEHMQDPLRPVLETLAGAGPVAWFLFLLLVVVPIGEEVFFRGFVYGGLRARWGAAAAALASAAFFAAVHMQLVHALPIFVLGVLLAVLYERTRSLVPSIVTHALTNVVAVMSVWREWGL
jgi:membrane protease YdiL (CAAX protease family)